MKKKVLIAFIIFSLIGFAASLYLTVEHFVEGKKPCDITPNISCSLVNSSIYSEIMGIPVATFGMVWFVALFLLAWNSYPKKNQKQQKLLYWNLMGFLFVVYLIVAEVLLQAICLVCTVVQAIVLLSLGVAIYSYKSTDL